jgi:hypothetical protein
VPIFRLSSIAVAGSGAGEQISFDVARPQEIASELRKIADWLDGVPELKAAPGERLLYDFPDALEASETAV